ncbi:hypothetical protein MKX01_011392, partial [Papaver californicum]
NIRFLFAPGLYDATIEKYKFVCFYKRKIQFKIVMVDVKSDSRKNVTAPSSPRLQYVYEAVFANGSLNWFIWREYNIKILQINNVPKFFNDSKTINCTAIVKNPTLMIIFWTTNTRIFDEPNERGFIRCYTPDFYSYDVELKTFAFIFEHKGIFVKWDLNSSVHFQSTFA